MKLKNKKELKQIKNLTSYKIDTTNFEIYEFVEDWAVIKDKITNKEGWINEDYTKLINPIFDNCWNFHEGYAVFRKNEKEGWMNNSGKIVGEGFDECYFFKEGFAIFEKDEKEGWMNNSGNILAEGFDWCDDFKDGFGKFEKDGKYSLINKEGQFLIFEVDWISELTLNLFCFKVGMIYGVININGEMLFNDLDNCPTIYNDYLKVERFEDFLWFKIKKKYWIDKTGEIYKKKPY